MWQWHAKTLKRVLESVETWRGWQRVRLEVNSDAVVPASV